MPDEKLIVKDDNTNQSNIYSNKSFDFTKYSVEFAENSGGVDYDDIIIEKNEQVEPNLILNNPAGPLVFFSLNGYSPIHPASHWENGGCAWGYLLNYYNGTKNRFDSGVQVLSYKPYQPFFTAKINLSPSDKVIQSFSAKYQVFKLSSTSVKYGVYITDLDKSYNVSLYDFGSDGSVGSVDMLEVPYQEKFAFDFGKIDKPTSIQCDFLINRPTFAGLIDENKTFVVNVDSLTQDPSKKTLIPHQIKEFKIEATKLFNVYDANKDKVRTTKLIAIYFPKSVKLNEIKDVKVFSFDEKTNTASFSVDQFKKGVFTLPVEKGQRKFAFSIRATDGLDGNNLYLKPGTAPDGYITIDGR